jgi:hypothetical protein
MDQLFSLGPISGAAEILELARPGMTSIGFPRKSALGCEGRSKSALRRRIHLMRAKRRNSPTFARSAREATMRLLPSAETVRSSAGVSVFDIWRGRDLQREFIDTLGQPFLQTLRPNCHCNLQPGEKSSLWGIYPKSIPAQHTDHEHILDVPVIDVRLHGNHHSLFQAARVIA